MLGFFLGHAFFGKRLCSHPTKLEGFAKTRFVLDVVT